MPLLKDAEREHARAAIEALEGALATPPPAVSIDVSRRGHGTAADASLCGGRAGIALFFAYLDRLAGRGGERACELLDDAVTAAVELVLPPDLYNGFAGIAWAVEHVGRTLGLDEDNALDEVDEVVTDLLAGQSWSLPYDLTSGLVGLGVYALERLPRPAARAMIERIVGHLQRLAEPGEGGVTWRTRREHLSADTRAVYPAEKFDLGVAHGVPGVLLLLTHIGAAGFCTEDVRALLRGGVQWLLRQAEWQEPSRFAYAVGPGIQRIAARCAWCYGDLGVSTAVIAVARYLQSSDLYEQGLGLLLDVARRPADQVGVDDACFCHGAAGLGHLLNRSYQRLGIEELGEAARVWYGRLLDFRHGDEGVGGFGFHFRPDRDTFIDDPGLLSGAAGVGLSLMAAISDVEPSWDRVFLLGDGGNRTS